MASCLCAEHSAPLHTAADVRTRCEEVGSFLATLERTAVAPERWLALLRCRVCGQFWAEEHPFSEHHGGGPSCVYQISISDPNAWLESAPVLATELVREQASEDFWSSLGPEVGPEECANPGCVRLRITLSSICKRHHVEMLERSRSAGPDAV